VVFDTIILGSNPSAPAKNKMLFSINIIKKIKEIIFPFYKSKELKKIFSLMSKDVPKNKQVAMFVGGCVRNYLNNKKIDDIDIATILSPSEIKEKFKNSDIRIIDTGIEHGSLTLIYNKCKFEITTLRKDVKTDGRHAEILLTDSWLEDSNRRDITINSIYLDNRGKIYDPHSGVDDLKNNVVKFIGDPNVRIQEDYLRIIRFLRFAIQYDSSTDNLTVESLKLNLNKIKSLSKERVLSELLKILKLKNFDNILKHKNKKIIFSLIFPELKNIDSIAKLKKLKNLKISFDLMLAILLIDGSNNHEYFCHKYKTSKAINESLSLLFKIYEQKKLDTNYLKKNLTKSTYIHGKSVITKIAILEYFKKSNMSFLELQTLIDKIEKIRIPKFPFDGKYLMNKGLNEGKSIGIMLEKLEKNWIENNYSLSDKKINEIISKVKI
jgi:poly(A) polymerase